MLDPLPPIIPCPFCRKPGELLECRYPLLDVRYHVVCCTNAKCDAEGPRATTQGEAVKLWNTRPTPKG